MNNANKHATNQISFIDLSLVRGDDPAFSLKKGLPIRRTRIQRHIFVVSGRNQFAMGRGDRLGNAKHQIW